MAAKMNLAEKMLRGRTPQADARINAPVVVPRPERRAYKICAECNDVVIVAGKPLKGDKICPHRFAPREVMTPTVYYENAKGEIWSGPDANAVCPLRGYERKEVQPHEVRHFEKLMTRKMQDAHKQQLERQREASEYNAQMRAEARKQMDAEVLEESKHWDSDARELLAYAMEHRDDPVFSRNYDPEVHIGAYN